MKFLKTLLFALSLITLSGYALAVEETESVKEAPEAESSVTKKAPETESQADKDDSMDEKDFFNEIIGGDESGSDASEDANE